MIRFALVVAALGSSFLSVSCSGSTGGSDGSDSGPADPELVPAEDAALRTYLDERAYLELASESAPHDSRGPHFGLVRTYVNGSLFDSLAAGASEHPVGAAAVKELYGESDGVQGHAVMVKIAPGSGADSWFYYEDYRGDVYADGAGVNLCVNCHAPGADYVLTPFPLE